MLLVLIVKTDICSLRIHYKNVLKYSQNVLGTCTESLRSFCNCMADYQDHSTAQAGGFMGITSVNENPGIV